MSSTLLYLAIVAVWAVVLVPMWLRRDSEATALSRILHRRTSEDGDELPADLPDMEDLDEEDGEDEDEPPTEVRPPRRNSRAAVIARRRRRTSGLLALVVLSAVAAGVGLGPWWVVLPPIGLLAGHLSLLRVAVGMDAVRRRELAESRARQRAAAARAAAEAEAIALPTAEIIDLPARSQEVFDQYADTDDTQHPRAVGD